ncbi:hypothetical protein C8Q73DRAFT_19491 [Cubamyces lactineus]|nr:hypothetical protein C8Q73DRAFT_19491 [Cubamyces lactineus]
MHWSGAATEGVRTELAGPRRARSGTIFNGYGGRPSSWFTALGLEGGDRVPRVGDSAYPGYGCYSTRCGARVGNGRILVQYLRWADLRKDRSGIYVLTPKPVLPCSEPQPSYWKQRPITSLVGSAPRIANARCSPNLRRTYAYMVLLRSGIAKPCLVYVYQSEVTFATSHVSLFLSVRRLQLMVWAAFVFMFVPRFPCIDAIYTHALLCPSAFS